MSQPQQLLACPFCGSNDLRSNLWSTDEGEEDAIECSQCFGSNLLKNWNTRPQNKDTQRLNWLADRENYIGNVQLPFECIEQNMLSFNAMRDAIDCAMALPPTED